MRDSFVFYRSFYSAISKCPESVQMELYLAVIRYGLNQEPPRFSECAEEPFLSAIWESIKPQLDANLQRYINGCKGGAPKGNKNAKKTTKNNQKQPNVNDNENVNVNENVNLPYSSREFVDTWSVLIRQPKWKNKTPAALSRAAKQLAQYPEGFAVELMNNAIASGYQGLVFANTPTMFEIWKRAHNSAPARTGKVFSSIEDLRKG